MKKFLTLFLSVMMIVSLFAFNASAAGETFKTDDDFKASDFGTPVYSGKADLDVIAGYKGTINENVYNLASGGNGFCVKTDGAVWYTFNAEKAGTYTIAFLYVARTGSTRGINYAIDPKNPDDQAEQTAVILDACDDNDDKRYCIITAELEAGEHSFYFAPVTGFDDSSLKSCDVYSLEVIFTAEKVVEDIVIAPNPNADATADTAVFAVAALVLSAAAVVVLSKKH